MDRGPGDRGRAPIGTRELQPSPMENSRMQSEHARCAPGPPAGGLRKQPRVEILSATVQDMLVQLRGVDRSVVNLLRNTLLADVPTLAIDTVVVEQYNSVEEVELVTLNLGFVPIRRKDGRVPSTEEEHTVGVHRSLEAGALRSRWVTSRDMVCSPGVEPVHYESKAQEAAAVFDNGLQIALLHPGTVLKIKGVVKCGTARAHPKWMAGRVRVRALGDAGDLPGAGVGDPVSGDPFEVSFSTFGAVTAPDAVMQALQHMAARMGHYAALRSL